MDDKEWNEKKKSICILVEDVHTDKQLCEYMCKQNEIREVADNVQYRFLLVPNFKDGKGCVILKSHHCMSDGLGFSTMFLCLSGDFDPNSLPGVKPLGLVKDIIITLLYPFLAARAGFEILTTFRKPNSINSDQKMTGKKRGAFTEDLNLDDMKTFCKSKEVTINDYLCALLSNSLYEYFENHKNEKFGGIPKNVSLCMPYSLR